VRPLSARIRGLRLPMDGIVMSAGDATMMRSREEMRCADEGKGLRGTVLPILVKNKERRTMSAAVGHMTTNKSSAILNIGQAPEATPRLAALVGRLGLRATGWKVSSGGVAEKESVPFISSFRFVPTEYKDWDDFQVLRASSRFDLHSVASELENERRHRAQKDRDFPYSARVFTLYKRKADKVLPVNSSASDGSTPGGLPDWRARAIAREVQRGLNHLRYKYDRWLHPRFATFPRGERLTQERLDAMIVGDMLQPLEQDLLVEMLYNREGALSWTFTELGRVSSEVAPPQVIRTIPHEAWQAKAFNVPKALLPTVIKLVKERLERTVIEPGHGPYRNPFFLVKKKLPGDYRLINAAMAYNRVSIRDANLPPSADDFAEEFACMHILSLIDWLSGYDQVPLAKECRDLTAFMTPLGLMRHTTLPQGATNSVAQFVRITNTILQHQIPLRARPFLDDCAIKGPKTDYNGEEVVPGVRRFVLEHIQNLDEVFCDLERAGVTISGAKSQFCMPGIKVVGYVCDRYGRHPDSSKIEKILKWPEPTNSTELKGFLGICVYYRIWIEDFAFKVEIFYVLLRKGSKWVWTAAHSVQMVELKEALTKAPALVSISYEEGAGLVIVAFDASKKGWGGVLMQLDEKNKRHPSRYESGVWSQAEGGYDAGKRECRALLKTLKKFRQWLYGISFLVETDAMTLAAQLNRSATDLPGALVTQWIAWIRLFDFEVRHVAGAKNVVADALSRRPATEEDVKEAEQEEDIDTWVAAQLDRVCISPILVQSVGEDAEEEDAVDFGSPLTGTVRIRPVQVSAEEGALPGMVRPRGWNVPLKEDEYSEESLRIGRFLQTLERPPGLNTAKWRQFRKEALKYLTKDGYLWRRPEKQRPPRRVIDMPAQREEIWTSLHDDGGHKGAAGTYHKVADRYWWNDLSRWCETRKRSCEPCQLRDSTRWQEEMYFTYVDKRWYQVNMDVTPMPRSKGREYLVEARSAFSGWVEARAMSKNDSQQVSRFFFEDVICRHGVPGKLVVDGGPENKKLTKTLAERYKIKRIVVSAYHPEANGLVEVGHRATADTLSKMSERKNGGDWVENLPAALWADRTTIKNNTGYSPYELEFLDRPVLPCDLNISTWHILPWNEVHTHAELIAMRARALQMREDDLEEAAARLRLMRERGKDQFDKRHRLRPYPLEPDMLVVCFDSKGAMDMSNSRKLSMRWLGPYRIKEAITDKGTYTLTELDGARLAGTFAGNRLKRFFPKEASEPAPPESEEMDWVPSDPEQEREASGEREEDTDQEEDDHQLGGGAGPSGLPSLSHLPEPYIDVSTFPPPRSLQVTVEAEEAALEERETLQEKRKRGRPKKGGQGHASKEGGKDSPPPHLHLKS
jgi:RNase H-like domain found in reverse transcriptase/Integrase zinc binding domain/Reverse transcriptase (RNA-dependent DNA polymerase)